MAKKAKKARKVRRPGPSPKARKAYIRNIEKSYVRLRGVIQKHNPDFIEKHGG